MNIGTRTRKTIATLAGLALLSVPLAACSDDEGGGDNGDNGSSSSSSGGGGEPAPVASIAELSAGGNTSVAIDPGFLEALEGLGVTPSPFNDAELADGAISFPITGGNVTVFNPDEVEPYVIGQVQHENSGLTLTAGDTAVTVGNFNVDPGVSIVYGDVSVGGNVAATSIPALRLDGRTLEPPTAEGGEAVLTGSEVYLTDGAATLLNETFGVDAITGDLLIGVATVTANIP